MREFLMRALYMMKMMQIAYRWRWPLALEKWSQKSSEWPKEASVKLKRPGSGMRMCKGLLRRGKNALGVYTWIGVQIM
jgi:hypothetical protein